MALNRYRMRHQARQGNQSARRVARLLERPDHLLGLILFGNNLVNILAASIATVIAYRLYGAIGVAVVPFLLTAVVLLLAEVAPKTVAVLYPDKIAALASWILTPLMWLAMPIVWLISTVSNSLLRLFGVRTPNKHHNAKGPTREELYAVLHEAGGLIPTNHREMLLNILELEDVRVEEVMVQRRELYGINIEDSEHRIREVLEKNRHSRLPVHRGDLDQVAGIINMRKLTFLDTSTTGSLKEHILARLDEPYYVPEGSSLHSLLIELQARRERTGLVVNEYGVVQGLVTLEDVLEHIVGEFTTAPHDHGKLIHPRKDGSVLVDGSVTIRELNRILGWKLPIQDAHTLNGLILEHLENIPREGTSLRIGDYIVEVTQAAGNAVKKAGLRQLKSAENNEHVMQSLGN